MLLYNLQLEIPSLAFTLLLTVSLCFNVQDEPEPQGLIDVGLGSRAMYSPFHRRNPAPLAYIYQWTASY
jgi:hypothetical protein